VIAPAARRGVPIGREHLTRLADLRSLVGACPWMFSHFAGMAGTRLLNFEPDLGDAGLMQAKRAMRPLAKAAKYRLWKIV
jgi:hypothetical protein